MPVIEIISLIIAGLLTGFINTLAGGGSIISLSLLIFLGLPVNIANGTNRIAVLFQTFVSSASFKQQKVLNIKSSMWYAAPAIIGAIVGARIAVHLNEEILKKVIACIMLVMLFVIIYKPNKWLNGQENLQKKKPGIIQIALFFIIGFYGGFIHVGIGFFLIASLVLGAGYDLVKANAIKVFIVLCYTVFALIIFILNDQINYKYGLILASGNIVGAFIASRIAVKKGANFVRWVIVFVILLTSTHLFGIIDIAEFISFRI